MRVALQAIACACERKWIGGQAIADLAALGLRAS
jgi:hypothetical protein